MEGKRRKNRLDTLLTERGLVQSRHQARGLIMAGKVRVNGVAVDKPGKELPDDVEISVVEDSPYVSRGGLKLAAALDAFGIDPSGLRVLDVGASTGGFTDCLLQHGAAKVVAVDVGLGQLDWTLRNDPRVTLLERTNIRFLEPRMLSHPLDAAVADVSFISLKLVLPRLNDLVLRQGWMLPMVKPQFEVGRFDVGKKGVVRDPERIRGAIDAVKGCAKDLGLRLLGETESPVKGPKGNREFFLYLVKP
jgi:23S rRNA (cytidine1920-2'-O)/16S rRNA (cytidine1409-2'-O)-methyltransferase